MHEGTQSITNEQTHEGIHGDWERRRKHIGNPLGKDMGLRIAEHTGGTHRDAWVTLGGSTRKCTKERRRVPTRNQQRNAKKCTGTHRWKPRLNVRGNV